MTVSIQRAVHVSREGQKLPWVVPKVETVDGIEYVELSRKKPKDLPDLNKQLCGGEEETLLFQKKLTSYQKRKSRERTLAEPHDLSYVLLDLPAVAMETEGGTITADALQMKVLR
eukprot:6471601-Amphidinium_carterae.1